MSKKLKGQIDPCPKHQECEACAAWLVEAKRKMVQVCADMATVYGDEHNCGNVIAEKILVMLDDLQVVRDLHGDDTE
jgi:hypothetical protein